MHKNHNQAYARIDPPTASRGELHVVEGPGVSDARRLALKRTHNQLALAEGYMQRLAHATLVPFSKPSRFTSSGRNTNSGASFTHSSH